MNLSTGMITTVAGNGTAGYSGDGGPATAAELSVPSGVAVDSAGDLFITDALSGRIREVANGVPVTVTMSSPTTTTVSSNQPQSSLYGQTVTFTATVSATSANTTPTGSVQFVVDGANFGSPVTLNGGTASVVVTTLTAGTHQIDAIYTSDNPDNFENSQTTVSLSQVVTPAPLTITADNQAMVYGGTLPALTASYSGFVNGDTSASLTTLPTLTTTATSASPLGNYEIDVSGAADANYNISYAGGTLTIGKATPTVSVSDAGGTYNGSSFTATATVAGVDGISGSSLEGISPTLLYYPGSDASGTGSTSAPIAAGTYTVVVSFAGSKDYAAALSQPVTFTISKAAPTVTVTDAGGTYNGSPYATTNAYVTGVPSDGTIANFGDSSLSYTYYAESANTVLTGAPTNAGKYAVVATFAGNSNYAATSSAGGLHDRQGHADRQRQ